MAGDGDDGRDKLERGIKTQVCDFLLFFFITIMIIWGIDFTANEDGRY